MSCLCIQGALLLLLGVDGARVRTGHWSTKDATRTSGNSSDSTSGCVEKASNQFCQGDGWYWNQGQCCNHGAYVSCSAGSQDFCKGSWKYLGNSQCCTTEWSACEESSQDFCKGDGWTYLGNKKCCLTSSYQQWLTCEKGSQDFCKSSPWKYLGNSKCCTTQYSHCVDGASQDLCRGDGWQYLGSGKCCATSSSKLNMQCGNYNMDSCSKYGGKYVGSGKCCWSQSDGANDCWAWCSKQYAYEWQNGKIDRNMPESAYVNVCVQQQSKNGKKCY